MPTLDFYSIILHFIPFFFLSILPATSSSSLPATIQLPHPPSSTTTAVSVTDYGATGDGAHYDTYAIQSAIDSCSPSSCSSSSTCYVNFPPGTYLTATIHLRSNVVLDIQPGAVLLGGPRLEDYPKQSSRWYVVLAENATDVGITGGGIVDGNGPMFVERYNSVKNVMVSWNATGDCLGDECRPRLIGFIGCTNVRVWNVSFTQPAYWWSVLLHPTICPFSLAYLQNFLSSIVNSSYTQLHFCSFHLVRCSNSLIHDISIYGDFNTPNNDGVDIEDSNNTVITRCHIDTGDDAICPKTYTGPLYNLTVTDCWIRTKSSAIKLGSASWFDFKGLIFDNITIVDSHRGLGFQIRDGGLLTSSSVFGSILNEPNLRRDILDSIGLRAGSSSSSSSRPNSNTRFN
ncbi:pehX [Linum grandiflorum]